MGGLPMLADANFVVVWQKQDHEALLLRHFPGHERDAPPRGRTMTALQAQWPRYRKGMSAAEISQVFELEHVRRAAGVTPALSELLRAIGL